MATSNLLQCNEWDIHYIKYGSGPVLILLHGGLPGTSGESAFSENIEKLAKYFTTYVIDFPGWGKSSKNLIPIGQWANPMEVGGQVIIAFMKMLGIEKAHLMGGSFGATAALYAAMNEPEMIDRMILMAPGGGITNKTSFPWPALIELITYYDPKEPTLDKFKSLANYMVYDKTLLTSQWIKTTFEASINQDVIKNPPLRLPPEFKPDNAIALSNDSRLSKLKSKVLFIWGREDQMQPVDCLQSFSAIRNQQSIILECCGHWPYREYSEEVNGYAIKFLN